MKRAIVLMFVMSFAVLGGCGSSEKTSVQKRDYDRTMMQLNDAQRERDELQQQLAQPRAAQANAEARVTEAQKELADSREAWRKTQIQMLDAESARTAKELELKKARLELESTRARAQSPATQPAPMNK